MFHYAGNMHMHTPYSDGEFTHGEIAAAAIDAGLDFIIVTDHNIWVDGLEGYYETANGRVLLLVGEEVHNVRRRPQASHYLAYGAERELSPFAADPQRLIDETIAAGGYGFLAHPVERTLPFYDAPDLGWKDWDIDGFTGLEIWNYMSSFKNRFADHLSTLRYQKRWFGNVTGLRLAFNPAKYMTEPEPEIIALWDRLLGEGKHVFAVGNSDAHGTHMSLGFIKRIIFPYEFLFRAVNTHLLIHEELNGNVEHDKALILDAIGHGHSWVGYDMPHSTADFRFTAQSVDKGTMGDTIRLDAGATLQIKAPTKANIRLIHKGEVIAATENETNLTHIPVAAGAYRVECRLPYEGAERGWIYSNPIFLR